MTFHVEQVSGFHVACTLSTKHWSAEWFDTAGSLQGDDLLTVRQSCRTVEPPLLQALLLGLQVLRDRLPAKLLHCRVLQALASQSCMLLLALRKNARVCLQRLCLFRAAAEGLDILLHTWETTLPPWIQSNAWQKKGRDKPKEAQ